MNNDYFQHVVGKLNIDDMNILGILTDMDATATFKAIRKKDVFERSGLSEANYRKVIYRLDAMEFIQTVVGGKEHMLFITDYGTMAINHSLGEVGE